MLTAVFSGIVILAVLPVLVVAYFGAGDNTSRLLRDRAQLQLQEALSRVEEHLRPAEEQLVFIAEAVRTGAVDVDDEAAMRLFVLGTLAATPQVTGIALTDPNGGQRRYAREDAAVAENPPSLPPPTTADLSVVHDADVGPPRWARPAWDGTLGQPILRLQIPLQGPSGFLGTLTSAIGIADLSRRLGQLQPDINATPFVLYDGAYVIAHPSFDPAMNAADRTSDVPFPPLARFADPVLANIWSEPRNSLSLAPFADASGHWHWVGDRSWAYVYRQVESFGERPWTIGVYFPGTDSRRERWVVRGIAIGGVVLLLMSVAAAVVIARRLGRPAQVLAEAARHVAALDLTRVRELPHGSIREVNEATEAFERMARGLRWFETYVPRTLVRRLMAAGDASPDAEEREVTIMFTDLQGFTAFSQASPPGAVAEYLNRLLARTGPLIEAGGGTIDKYMGDGMMAFWGAPEERLDHARAACSTALRMAAAVTDFNNERRMAGNAACAMRIGIHTGRVVVGNIGFAGRVDYTIIGSAANSAQRIEQACKAYLEAADSVVVVSDATRRAAGAGFLFEEMPDPCYVGGEAVRLWKLAARRASHEPS